MEYERKPTIIPNTEFEAEKYASYLREAFNASKTNETTVYNILTCVSNEQRQKLKEHYNSTYDRDLIADLKSKVSVGHVDVFLALMMPPANFVAKEIHEALNGENKDNVEYVLIDTLLPIENDEGGLIYLAYKKMYNTAHFEEIQDKLTGDFQDLFYTCCTMCRDVEGAIRPESAEDDAKELFDLSKGELNPTQELFYQLLCKCSFAQCLLIFEEYKKLAGYSVEEAIKRGTKERVDVMLSIVECIQNVPAYYATRLFKAMDGAGTDDTSLIRIIISRSEIDLGNIKEEFERLYNRSLVSAVKSETSGDYKRALCGIIGEDIGEE